jgi:DNA replication protein DnaC
LYEHFELEEMVGADNLQEIKDKVNCYINNLPKVEREGHNLYIYSRENGTGKTALGYYILKQVKGPRLTYSREDNTEQIKLTQIVSTSFFNYLKFCVDMFAQDAKKAKEMVETAPFLLLDDVSPWALSSSPHRDKAELIALMMYRREEMLPTIYTSNLTPEAFEQTFGATAASKIFENFSFIEVRGGDVRPLLFNQMLGEDK